MAQGDFVKSPYWLPTAANQHLAGRVATVHDGATVAIQEVLASVAGYSATGALPTSYGMPTVAVATMPVPTGYGLPTVAIGAMPAASGYGLPTVSVAAVPTVNGVVRELVSGAPAYYSGVGPATVVASGVLQAIRAFSPTGADAYLRLNSGASVLVREQTGFDWSPVGTYANPIFDFGAVDYLIEVQQ